jgi:hypothetical protein
MWVTSTFQWKRIARVVVQPRSPCANLSEMIPGNIPTASQKVTGLKSESAPGFIPESCPSSFRNAARDDFGIVPTLPRNPQLFVTIQLTQRRE